MAKWAKKNLKSFIRVAYTITTIYSTFRLTEVYRSRILRIRHPTEMALKKLLTGSPAHYYRGRGWPEFDKVCIAARFRRKRWLVDKINGHHSIEQVGQAGRQEPKETELQNKPKLAGNP